MTFSLKYQIVRNKVIQSYTQIRKNKIDIPNNIVFTVIDTVVHAYYILHLTFTILTDRLNSAFICLGGDISGIYIRGVLAKQYLHEQEIF